MTDEKKKQQISFTAEELDTLLTFVKAVKESGLLDEENGNGAVDNLREALAVLRGLSESDTVKAVIEAHTPAVEDIGEEEVDSWFGDSTQNG